MKLLAVALILLIGGAYFIAFGIPRFPMQTVIGQAPYYQYASISQDGAVTGYLAIQMLLTPSTAIHFAYIGGDRVSGGTGGATTDVYPLPNLNGKTVNATTPIKIELYQTRTPYFSVNLQSLSIPVTPALTNELAGTVTTIPPLELQGYEYSAEQGGWKLNVPFKIVVKDSGGNVLYSSQEYNLMSLGSQIDIGYQGIKIMQVAKPTNTVDQTRIPSDILILNKYRSGTDVQNLSSVYYFDDSGTNCPSSYLRYTTNSWAKMIYGVGIQQSPPVPTSNWGSYAGYTIGYDVDTMKAVWKAPWLYGVSYAPNDVNRYDPYYGVIDTLLNKDTRHNVPYFRELSSTFVMLGMKLDERAKTLSYDVSAFENSAFVVVYVPMSLVGGRVAVENTQVPDAKITGVSIVQATSNQLTAGTQYTLKVDVTSYNGVGDVVVYVAENIDYLSIAPSTDGAYLGASQTKSFYFTISTGVPPHDISGAITVTLNGRNGAKLDERSTAVTLKPIPAQSMITVKAYAVDVYGIRSEISATFTIDGVRYTTPQSVQVPVGTHTIVFDRYASGQLAYISPAPVVVSTVAGENRLVEGVYQMVAPTESVVTVKALKNGQYVNRFSGQIVLANGTSYAFSTEESIATVKLGGYTGVAVVKSQSGIIYEGSETIVVARGVNDVTVTLGLVWIYVFIILALLVVFASAVAFLLKMKR